MPENGIGRFQVVIDKLLIKDKKDKTFVKIKKTCIMQTTMKNIIKSYILKDIYYDVDIHNCQPYILEHLLVKNNIECKYIKIYNNRRDELFQIMIDKFNVTKKDIKEFLYRVLFGGGSGN